jgi:hypothetical protein
MDRNWLKKTINRIISSDPRLKNDYDVLRKNKTGHMTSRINEDLSRKGDKYLAGTTRYIMANSEEITKKIYSSIINSRIKERLGRSFIRISDSEFDSVMREVIDDLDDEE